MEWAKFFDEFSIKWEYNNPLCAQGSEADYVPAFYLPEIKTFFGVVDHHERDDRSNEKEIISLAEAVAKKRKMVVVGCFAVGKRYWLVFPTPEMAGEGCDENGSIDWDDARAELVLCGKCGKWHFEDLYLGWVCLNCGAGGESSRRATANKVQRPSPNDHVEVQREIDVRIMRSLNSV